MKIKKQSGPPEDLIYFDDDLPKLLSAECLDIYLPI